MSEIVSSFEAMLKRLYLALSMDLQALYFRLISRDEEPPKTVSPPDTPQQAQYEEDMERARKIREKRAREDPEKWAEERREADQYHQIEAERKARGEHHREQVAPIREKPYGEGPEPL